MAERESGSIQIHIHTFTSVESQSVTKSLFILIIFFYSVDYFSSGLLCTSFAISYMPASVRDRVCCGLIYLNVFFFASFKSIQISVVRVCHCWH